jgi:hypothetical protein
MNAVTDKQLYLPAELQLAHERLHPELVKMKNMVFYNDNADARVECFISIGTFDKDTRAFNTNIPSLHYYNTLHMLRSYREWKSVVFAQDSHEYVYSIDSFKDRQKQVKQYRKNKKKEIMQASQSTNCVPNQTHLISSKVCFAEDNMKIEHTYNDTVSTTAFNVADSEPIVDVRVTVRKKINVKNELLPGSVIPQFVRIRKQSIFALENWQFVFTQEWTGLTRIEAERKQCVDRCGNTILNYDDHTQNAPDSSKNYKIKIEFIGTKDYISSISPDYLTVSLLLKICSLLGGNIFSIQPL